MRREEALLLIAALILGAILGLATAEYGVFPKATPDDGGALQIAAGRAGHDMGVSARRIIDEHGWLAGD